MKDFSQNHLSSYTKQDYKSYNQYYIPHPKISILHSSYIHLTLTNTTHRPLYTNKLGIHKFKKCKMKDENSKNKENKKWESSLSTREKTYTGIFFSQNLPSPVTFTQQSLIINHLKVAVIRICRHPTITFSATHIQLNINHLQQKVTGDGKN